MGTLRHVAELLLWLSLATVGYVYVGYPLTLLLLPRRRSRSITSNRLPRATVVIAAYNEAEHIANTVRNKLAQDYPADLLDVLVVSDGSSDGTDDIVTGLGAGRITLLRQEPRQGKTLALNRGVAAAQGELIIFSDANSLFEPDAVRRLAEAFDDPTVGYATGRLIYRDPGESAVGAGAGMYMNYESWLRRLETRVGSVVGVNGGIDAVRKVLYEPMRGDQLPDFVLPLQVVARRHRVVYCPEAISTEESLGWQRDEYRMRVRVSLRALHALSDMRSQLGFGAGLFAFQLLVHKVLRYLLVLPLAGALVSNLALVASPGYVALFALQLACYVLAFVGWLSGGSIRFRPVFVPFYFCLLNLAAGEALLRFLRGQRQVLWTPRRGA
jgi:cellulose synthase/poly-beta-1,6-N-acetylglucosamine synthase-like glycosyltransferase